MHLKDISNLFVPRSEHHSWCFLFTIQDAIHRIKKTFNKEFDQTFTKKESEINKIKDKNKRIRKILEDLNMDPEIYEPELGSIEKPEMLLTVADSEVRNNVILK